MELQCEHCRTQYCGQRKSFTVKASWNSTEADQLKNPHPGTKKPDVQAYLLTHGIWAWKLSPQPKKASHSHQNAELDHISALNCWKQSYLSSKKNYTSLLDLLWRSCENLFLNLPTSPEKLDLKWISDLRGRIFCCFFY